MSAASTQPVLEVNNLECRYDETVILQNVSFAVAPREIFFVAGRSGCGKTTLMRHLVGLQAPAKGRIVYFGKDFTAANSSERRQSRPFGVLLQNNALWTDMTLAENISLPLMLHTDLSRETRREIIALKLAQVGLAECQDRFPRELSGGMCKRAALARALALEPSILFFDEPTAGLDPIMARQIDGLIIQVRQTTGATVIVVSHSLSSIFHIADRMILLDPETRGIIAEGAPAELAASGGDPRVQEFLGEMPRSKGRP
ncbi:MAG TPA: ATP-binding cassette domain-containing protein [Verrucomicrobiae bacterium]|jgi:phospholipid/cholesterol/gamma-HCH transport system ATP-binding protein